MIIISIEILTHLFLQKYQFNLSLKKVFLVYCFTIILIYLKLHSTSYY